MKHIKLFESFMGGNVTPEDLQKYGIREYILTNPHLKSWFSEYGVMISEDPTYDIFDDEDFWNNTEEVVYQMEKTTPRDPELLASIAWSKLLNYILDKGVRPNVNSLEDIFQEVY